MKIHLIIINECPFISDHKINVNELFCKGFQKE